MLHTSDSAQNTARLPRVTILGLGSMGGSILTGLQHSELETDGPIRVTTNSPESAERLAGEENVAVSALEETPSANRDAASEAELVILAVKPWLVLEVLRDIAAVLNPGTIVASVAAGITIDAMRVLVPDGVTVARTMPNTPSEVGLGMTGISVPEGTDPERVALIETVFNTVGRTLVVPESQIDALTAVSGSGPAYLFWFAEELSNGAKRLGFTEEQAQLLAETTISGAAALMFEARSDGVSPEQLRKNVTSPNGTTEKAVQVFQGSNFGATVDQALRAAADRAAELAAENSDA